MSNLQLFNVYINKLVHILSMKPYPVSYFPWTTKLAVIKSIKDN